MKQWIEECAHRFLQIRGDKRAHRGHRTHRAPASAITSDAGYKFTHVFGITAICLGQYTPGQA